jgi:hypothetical protein
MKCEGRICPFCMFHLKNGRIQSKMTAIGGLVNLILFCIDPPYPTLQ